MKPSGTLLIVPGRTYSIPDESAMRSLGAIAVKELKAGDLVLLLGPLGAGKTTLVRGMLEGLGWREPVRSPTFNLIQVFDTEPPVMHADLFRVQGAAGLGIEDYLTSHLCLIEWADRAPELSAESNAIRIEIEFDEPGRKVSFVRPK